MSRHISGPKLCKHTTVTAAAEEVVKKIILFPEVTKVSLAKISQATGTFYMKFFDIHGGWRIHIRGSRAIQKVIVYTKDKLATRKKLEGLYPGTIFDGNS